MDRSLGSSTHIPSKVIGQKRTITYTERRAVRLIATNDSDQLILIFIPSGSYYKLPGGGVEADENHRSAGAREAKEETGCTVAVDDRCVATAEEWRNDLHQISYCYRAQLIDDTGTPELTDDERAEGLTHEWVSTSTAIEKMEKCQPTSELGRCIKKRDIFFVQTYLKEMQ